MLSKDISIPLYEQVANELRKEILSDQYGRNGSIGTHAQLAERFSVSLITIKKALQILERESMVDIQQGKGTFVHQNKMVDPLKNLTGISYMMKDLHIETRVSVPVIEVQPTPSWLSKNIRKIFGPQCLFILRVVSIADIPVANTEMWLPLKYEEFFTKEKVEKQTIYQIYQNEVGIVLGKGKQIICAAGARGLVAKNLELHENHPVLQITREAYSDTGELIEYMVLSYEASRYSFSVELQLNSDIR